MISMIVAMTESGIIGYDNKLPWALPGDLKHFKDLTVGKTVIMGRKTYESIGKSLPNRQNIVLTHSTTLKIPGVEIAHSIEESLRLARSPEIMIIGGAQIYGLFLSMATKLYITYVKANLNLRDAVRFPPIDPSRWLETYREPHYKDDKHTYDYDFVVLKRMVPKY